MNNISTSQIRDLQGQKILVLEQACGDYWLVCRISQRDAPICSEEYQLPWPKLQCQYTFTAKMSERWLRFHSKWIGQITDGELSAIQSLRFALDHCKPVPKALADKIGPEWSHEWPREALDLFDQIVACEQREFEEVLEPQEA